MSDAEQMAARLTVPHYGAHVYLSGGSACRCSLCDAAALLRSQAQQIERLREALSEIASIENVDVDGLWEERPALERTEMFSIARAALEANRE